MNPEFELKLELKLEDHFPWLEKFFPEPYETLKKRLTEGIAVPEFPAGFKVYEKEALIGNVLFILVDSFYTDLGYHGPPTTAG